MRQFVAILPDGRLVGIVLDDRPMSSEQEMAARVDVCVARSINGVRYSAFALGADEQFEVCHHRRLSHEGPKRRWRTVTYCRAV